MKALCIENNNLQLKTVPLPTKQSDRQILVKVHAMGLNRADLLQAEGLYLSPDGSSILGLELSGIREDNGDAVCALVNSSAFAEYVYVYPEQLMPVCDGTDLTSSAALPEALLSCWLNMFTLGNLKAEEFVLIHGGSSGIGSFAVQIANAYGCKVFTTVGSNHKKDFCITLGADLVLNYHEEDYAKVIKELGGIDFILDILGGEYLDKNISCLKKQGRLALIAVMAGSSATVNAASVLMKNLKIYGSTLRSQSLETKAKLISEVVENIYPLIQSGDVKPKIDLIYNFEDYRLAFERMKHRKNLGKILLIF